VRAVWSSDQEGSRNCSRGGPAWGVRRAGEEGVGGGTVGVVRFCSVGGVGSGEVSSSLEAAASQLSAMGDSARVRGLFLDMWREETDCARSGGIC
jgi:hypothetical protein